MALNTKRRKTKAAKIPFGHCLPTFSVPQPQVGQHEACNARYISDFTGETVEHFCVCECHAADGPAWASKCVKTELPEGYARTALDKAASEDEDDNDQDNDQDSDQEESVIYPSDWDGVSVTSATFAFESDTTSEDIREIARDLEVTFDATTDDESGQVLVTFTGPGDAVESVRERYDSMELPEGDATVEPLLGVVEPPVTSKKAPSGFISKRQTKIPPPIKRGEPRWTMEDGVTPATGMRVKTKDGRHGVILETLASAAVVRIGATEVEKIGYHKLNGETNA
jgi:hypothetical protein